MITSTVMYAILVLSFIFKNLMAESLQYDDNVLKVMEEFDVNHPYILASDIVLYSKWIKILSKHSKYSGKLKDKKLSLTENEELMIFLDENNMDNIVEVFAIFMLCFTVFYMGLHDISWTALA